MQWGVVLAFFFIFTIKFAVIIVPHPVNLAKNVSFLIFSNKKNKKTGETVPLLHVTDYAYVYRFGTGIVETLTVTGPYDPSSGTTRPASISKFDEFGNLIESIDPNHASDSSHHTKYEYVSATDNPVTYKDAIGKIKSITDPLGKVTLYQYPDLIPLGGIADGIADIQTFDPLLNRTDTNLDSSGDVLKLDTFQYTLADTSYELQSTLECPYDAN